MIKNRSCTSGRCWILPLVTENGFKNHLFLLPQAYSVCMNKVSIIIIVIITVIWHTVRSGQELRHNAVCTAWTQTMFKTPFINSNFKVNNLIEATAGMWWIFGPWEVIGALPTSPLTCCNGAGMRRMLEIRRKMKWKELQQWRVIKMFCLRFVPHLPGWIGI